jgi:hypothetical protein
MLSSRSFRALAPQFLALAFLATGILQASSQAQSSSSEGQSSSSSSAATPVQPAVPKAPSLIDPAGPQISLQTSEAVFDIAVALNTCGYDAGLEQSPPIRLKIRDQVNAAVAASADAQSTRDQLCAYIRQHELSDYSHNLSQYISLSLYVTPPPDLTNSVPLTEMPPDSTQVVEILPLLRKFARQIDLHYIWIAARPQYDAIVNSLHDPLTKMVVGTNVYLKMPANTDTDSHFAVVLEPLLDPGQTNARVYGADYVVVTSPNRDDKVRMDEIRHTYLHFVLEPLLYSRASSMDRLLPFLKAVREAPLEYTFRSDIVSLVTECMIRAVEARTMDTGVAPFKAPAVVTHTDFATVEHERRATEQKAEAVRQASVKRSMEEGYVLTAYFYGKLIGFEKEPQSFKETIGEIVYGMDVPSELGHVKHITFSQQNEGDVVHHGTRQLHGLDLAEMKLMQGDVNAASTLAHQELDRHTGDAARADFLLARCAIMQRNVEDARHYFEETVRLGKDPRLLAWSHIYLGRMDDLENSRDEAVAQYQQALVTRDGQLDTKEAAERGLKQPYGPPPGARQQQDDSDDDSAPAKDAAPTAQPPAPAPQAPAAQTPAPPAAATPQR